jgi:hypothetical protein
VKNYIRTLQNYSEFGAAFEFNNSKAVLVDFFDAIIFIDKIEESNMLE